MEDGDGGVHVHAVAYAAVAVDDAVLVRFVAGVSSLPANVADAAFAGFGHAAAV